MMKIANQSRYVLLTLLIMCFAAAWGQQVNVLSVADAKVSIGQAQLPVAIENTDEIVAVQFDLTLPSTISAGNDAVLTNRCDGHTIIIRNMSATRYRVMLYSDDNRPLIAQKGTVFYIPLTIPQTVEEGSELPLVISNATLSVASGENVLTGTNAGKLMVSKLPDLTVKSIHAESTTITPGELLSLSWQVENVGGTITGGGWSEQILLVNKRGTVKKLLGTIYQQETLAAGELMSRQADIMVPQLLGIEDEAHIQVKVIANSETGESTLATGNNTLQGEQTFTLAKRLFVEISPTLITEGGTQRVAVKVNRSGDWSSEQTFALSATTDSRIQLPTQMTVPVGQSGAVVYMTVSDNSVLDDNDKVTISAKGNSYSDGIGTLTIEDNEYPNLTLTASKSEITEGEAFQLTVTTSRISAQPITVSISSEYPKRFSFPMSIVIPAGETSATVDVVAKENDDIELETSVAFHVSEATYNDAECLILLYDNDMPSISLTLTPTSVSESAGPTAMIGTIKRISNIDKKVTIVLSDDGNGDVYYSNKTIVMEKGVESVQFSLGVIDNVNVDGNRIVNITASIYASSCNCSVKGDSEGTVSVPITIIDDDGPSLKIITSFSSWLEGSDKNVLTITRNTSTEKALIVELSSDHDALLDYEKSIVIPVGKRSVNVIVAVKSNDQTGDNTLVSFTVKSEGYADGACWIQLTDQTLPDAVITSFSSNIQEIEAGGKVNLSIQLSNIGNAVLPAQTPVFLSFSGDGSQAKLYTQVPIEPGEILELQKEVTMSQIVGTYYFNAVVNHERSVKELIYANNESEQVKLTLLPNFTATAIVDKDVYNKGEYVIISGHITGTNVANSQVEVYIINDGLRMTQNATTDANGDFSITWQPHTQQCGHFIVGACFPGEKKQTEMDSFDVYGIRFSSQYSTYEIDLGDTANGEIRLTNPGILPLTGLTAELGIESDAVTLTSVPNQILGGETVTIKYLVKGNSVSTGSNWIKVPIIVKTNEGVGGTFNVNYYVYSLKGKLVTSESNIRTTMIKGQSRDYPITIGNIGKGETGKITVDIGNVKWLSCATSIEMASLKSGETTTAILRFTPTDDMQLNNPVTCQLAINCENGDAVVIPMVVEPVSNEMGMLTIDVCDENTYYTVEAPHVVGAKVTVQHPTTYTVIDSGTTGEDGKCSFTLPEGYYLVTVTEAKHDSYANNIMVDPGTETFKKVNIGINGVSVDMRYESTEIEDQYEIVTTVKYETNVPVPVVETILPQRIAADELEEGESLLFYAILTNKGLVTALNTQLVLPESNEKYEITSLGEYIFDLAPQQSMTIPVKVTRRKTDGSRGTRRSRGIGIRCYEQTLTYYESYCGDDKKIHYDKHTIQFEVCVPTIDNPIHDNTPITSSPSGPNWWYTEPSRPSGPNIVGPITYHTNDWGEVLADKLESFVCDPCVNKKMKQLADCFDIDPDHPFQTIIKKISGDAVGCAVDIYNCYHDNSWLSYDDCISNIIGCLLKACQAIGGVLVGTGTAAASTGVGAAPGGTAATVGGAMVGFCKVLEEVKDGGEKAKCWIDVLLPCDADTNTNAEARSLRTVTTENNSLPSYITQFQEKMTIGLDAHDATIAITREILGYDAMRSAEPNEIYVLLQKIAESEVGDILDAEILDEYRPENVSKEDFSKFIIRLNNTTLKEQGLPYEGDCIDISKLNESSEKVGECINRMLALGYNDMSIMVQDAMTQLENGMENQRSSICSSITLKLSQTMTMTRQAIRGTLTVYNGNEDTVMNDVKLSLVVHNADGNIAGSNLIEIVPETLNGFEGQLDLSSGWSLGAKSEGVATILFIPTKSAAPIESQPYTFTGTISYVDPFTGLVVTRELAPATITVNPSPVLDLTYFMQRDIYGDDPLTLDDVESKVPAEFTLLINNKGYGDANNVRMLTKQPEIIENEKGLANKIAILSSQLNGEGKNLSLGQSSINNDFGTIPAHSQIYAQWWLESDFLGHFVDYKVEASHVTSYGNEDLSLLDQVTIHELIHGFDMPIGSLAGGPEIGRAFLVNDVADAEDLPDKLYFSNGDTASVVVTTTAQIERTSPTTCLLTITPSATGWNYGSLIDPTHGYAELKSIVRQSDGAELGSPRFWQTDRTLRDGKDWLYEYRLHFVDVFNGTSPVTYLLTFDPVPEKLLEVTSILTVPEEGDIATESIDKLTVDFNKPIDASTFTGDDITFAVQGVKQDANQIAISTEDNKTFTLDMTAMNDALPNGYYTLTVQTADITDTEGFLGKSGKQVGWILFRGGLVQLLLKAYPENSGTVIRKSVGSAEYGSTVVLFAEPKDGYEFSNWTLNGDVVSNEPEYTTTALGDMDIVANFTKKKYVVEIGVDGDGGTTQGTATGIYEYGTEISVSAVADNDYVFKGWILDGKPIAETATTITLRVEKPIDIKANFTQEYYSQTMTLARGWNWISSYLNEPLAFSGMAGYVNRIVGQFDELVNDPVYGLVGNMSAMTAGKSYKVEANTRFSNPFRGHLYNIETTPITVHAGWNWIGYPFMDSHAIGSVIQNAEEGDYVVSQTGFAEYADGFWEGTLNAFEPGAGYLYKSLSDKTLSIDLTPVSGSRPWKSRLSANDTQVVDIHRYPNTMNITARIYHDDIEQPSSAFNVYAMANDELRGVGKYVGNNYYLTVYGEEPVEITFVIESTETGNTYIAEQMMIFRDGVVGSRRQPYAICISSATGIDTIETATRPMTIYSMEGILISRDATIKALRKLPKGIYIVNGQKCYVN